MTNGRSLHDLMRFSSSDHTIEKVGPQAFVMSNPSIERTHNGKAHAKRGQVLQ
jgi:hypothetical protein